TNVCKADELVLSVVVTAMTNPCNFSLHDALPIYQEIADATVLLASSDSGLPGHHQEAQDQADRVHPHRPAAVSAGRQAPVQPGRSEEHTSELQSREKLVCRLLLEKKKTINQSDSS